MQVRLIADVPLGSLLSGGLDSGIIAAAMRDAGANPLRTYTVGFEDDARDGFVEDPVTAVRYLPREFRGKYDNDTTVAGCGLCQTKVPCEFQNPTKKLKR